MDTGMFKSLAFKFDGQDLVFQLTPADQIFLYTSATCPLHSVRNSTRNSASNTLSIMASFPVKAASPRLSGQCWSKCSRPRESRQLCLPRRSPIRKSSKITAVSFSVTNPPVLVGDITPESSAALDPKVLPILARLSGSSYDSDGSPEQIATNIGLYYQDQGYLEAAVRANPSAVPSIAPDAIRIPFSVSVTPGIRYKVKEIRLDPGLVVTQPDFDRQSHIHPGDPADGEHIRANWLYRRAPIS